MKIRYNLSTWVGNAEANFLGKPAEKHGQTTNHVVFEKICPLKIYDPSTEYGGACQRSRKKQVIERWILKASSCGQDTKVAEG